MFVTIYYGFVTVCNFLEFSQNLNHFFPFTEVDYRLNGMFFGLIGKFVWEIFVEFAQNEGLRKFDK